MLTSKILLDASPLCEEQLTGIGTYAKNLIQHLHQMNSFNINLGLPLSRISKRSRVQKKIGYKVQLENKFTNIFGNNYDVVHGLDFNFKIKMSSNTKKVITVHDMAAFEHNLLENHFAFMARSKLYSTIANEKPDLVLCVSEFTKNRFLHFFPHYADKTMVTPLGCDHITPALVRNSQQLSEKFLNTPSCEEAPYILYVGTLEKRKNLKLLLDAFKLLKDRNSELTLKIVGKIGYKGEEIISLISQHKYKNQIQYFGYVDSLKLHQLYKWARVFVYPSIYEGFGIPVLEAMKWSLPVVAVNASAVAEVAKGAVFLVEPNHPELMSFAIRKAHEDSEARQVLIQEGIKRSNSYTWSKTAQLTNHAYNLVTEQSGLNVFQFQNSFNII